MSVATAGGEGDWASAPEFLDESWCRREAGDYFDYNEFQRC